MKVIHRDVWFGIVGLFALCMIPPLAPVVFCWVVCGYLYRMWRIGRLTGGRFGGATYGLAYYLFFAVPVAWVAFGLPSMRPSDNAALFYLYFPDWAGASYRWATNSVSTGLAEVLTYYYKGLGAVFGWITQGHIDAMSPQTFNILLALVSVYMITEYHAGSIMELRNVLAARRAGNHEAGHRALSASFSEGALPVVSSQPVADRRVDEVLASDAAEVAPVRATTIPRSLW